MKTSKVLDKKDIKKSDLDNVRCPHCKEIFKVNAGQMLGQKSGLSRKGDSLYMRELVELRWAKKKKVNKL